MVWAEITRLEVRKYRDSELRPILDAVKKYVEGFDSTTVIHSDNLFVKPRVTAVTVEGRDFLLAEETYPFGSEGRAVGTGYSARILWSDEAVRDEQQILYQSLSKVIRETNAATTKQEVPAQ